MCPRAGVGAHAETKELAEIELFLAWRTAGYRAAGPIFAHPPQKISSFRSSAGDAEKKIELGGPRTIAGAKDSPQAPAGGARGIRTLLPLASMSMRLVRMAPVRIKIFLKAILLGATGPRGG